MRPKKLSEVVGQEHLIAPGKIIYRMVKANRLSSMIFYGPPGVGKTSLARAIANTLNFHFEYFNASKDDKKKLQVFATQAKFLNDTYVILIDEIHRLDKSKQDYLLSFMEDGDVIVIGATTENPYISILPAIRSRCQIFELKPVTPNDISIMLKRALTDEKNGFGKDNVVISDDDINWIAENTNGDVRSALNGLELAVLSTPKTDDKITINREALEECLQRKSISGDKHGDSHYDTISAFQKSIRGSDADAALHYLAKILETGDIEIVCRRLLVIAFEDIGLAYPQAGTYTVAAVDDAKQLGLPEARIPLSDAVIMLSLAPKSNTGYTAIEKAMTDLESGKDLTIPKDLKDSHYKGSKNLGHGIGYKYPHDYVNDWIPQQYLPTSIMNNKYVNFSGDGKFEAGLQEKYTRLKKLQLENYKNNNTWKAKNNK